MDAWKWIQLIVTVLLILLPAAIHYRNWKHADKRTRLHRWITKGLLGLWGLSAIGSAFPLYHVLSKKDPAPVLALRVNRLFIPHHPGTNSITIPTEPDEMRLYFSAINAGNWAADSISVSVTPPQGIKITKFDGWNVGTAEDKDGNQTVRYYVESTHTVCFPREGFDTPLLAFECTNMMHTVNAFDVIISCKNAATERHIVWIHPKAVGGTNKAYVAF